MTLNRKSARGSVTKDIKKNLKGYFLSARTWLGFKRAYNSLKLEREITELIMNSSRSMLTVINRDYIYEKVNSRFCSTHSKDNSLIEGRSLKDIWGEENFKKNIKPAIDRCLSGEAIQYEAGFETSAGNYRYYDINFRPLCQTGGQVTHLLAETFDITDQKEAEQAFRQAQKLESVGALAGGIAHDFNNILTTIYGYAEMSLDDVEKSSTIHENINKIISAVSKARSLTNQILTFSRHIEQEKVAVNLWQVVNETVSYLKSGLPHNINIIDQTEDTGLLVLADPTQLFRVFMNLFTNAVQAMEGRGGELSIGIQAGSYGNDKEHVNVVVSDTGVGIDESVIERIFEPFFTTSDVGKGTGLGLSVVHGIVSEIGGSIDVESKTGKGTKFTVSLPVLSPVPDPPDESMAAGYLLFISEKMHESRILCLALENLGYRISHASSGDEFHRQISTTSYKPDLIIFMDDIDGFSLRDLENLTEKTGLDIPLLLITGSQDLILTESFLNSGFVKHFLMKPVSLREVRNAIEVVLTGK